MSLRTLFRVLVLLSLALSLMGVAYRVMAEANVSDDWKSVLAWDGNGGWADQQSYEDLNPTFIAWIIFCLGTLIAEIVLPIGLFLFRPWARTGFLVLAAVLLISAPAVGLIVTLPVEDFLYQAANLGSGVVLAMAYFSPVRREFAKNRRMRRHHIRQEICAQGAA